MLVAQYLFHWLESSLLLYGGQQPHGSPGHHPRPRRAPAPLQCPGQYLDWAADQGEGGGQDGALGVDVACDARGCLGAGVEERVEAADHGEQEVVRDEQDGGDVGPVLGQPSVGRVDLSEDEEQKKIFNNIFIARVNF